LVDDWLFEYCARGEDEGWTLIKVFHFDDEARRSGWRYDSNEFPWDRHRGDTPTAGWRVEQRLHQEGGWGPGTYNMVAHNCWHFAWHIRNNWL
jgi:hypothetical protein